MKRDFYYLSKDDKTRIHAIEWIPEGEPRALLQICHGMVEYIGRYDRFATFLAEQGFYVVGNDHLGHGESVLNEDMHGFFADPNGNECVIGDIHTLRGKTDLKYPGVPYFFMGHSMGSFLARQYIEMHGAGLEGAIIMGTGSQPDGVLKIAKWLCKQEEKKHGSMYRSALINQLAMGGYNKKFKPARTTQDWLTRDTAIVDAYLADPWCTFCFTVNAFYHMFRGIEYIQKPEHIDRIPKDLPLLLVSGADDPVGGFGKGVETAFRAFQKAGIKDITMKLYEHDRHEILNELDKKTVDQDLLEWMTSRI